jgi:hypothetical protein
VLPELVRREAAMRLNATPGAAALVHSGYLAFANALAGLASGVGGLSAAGAAQLERHYAELVNAGGLGADTARIELAREALLRHHGLG